jgi:transcriptional regulator with XRE-family HTH domain
MGNAFTIAALRRRAGLTQAELAASIGISQAYLSMIETGRRTTMSANTYLKLVAELRLSSEERSQLDKYFLQGVDEGTVGGAA